MPRSRSCPASPSTSRRPSAAPCWPSARPSDRLLAQFLATKIGAKFKGRISGVTRSGLFVRLLETGADGFIPASTLGQDYYRYVEEMQAMVGDRTGEMFRLGDTVKVRLLEAAPVAGALRFELLSRGHPRQSVIWETRPRSAHLGRTVRRAAGDRQMPVTIEHRHRSPLARHGHLERHEAALPPLRQGPAVPRLSQGRRHSARPAARSCTSTAPTTSRPISRSSSSATSSSA